jgi:hypothetical protein
MLKSEQGIEGGQISRDDLAQAVRSVKKNKGDRMTQLRKIVADRQANRVEGLFVDGFTASAVVQVFDACNEHNKALLLSFPLRKMVAVVWKVVNKQK